ncbi:MAG: CBS domain-containing protein [Candidatus Nanopelagicales bacterium]
MRARDLAEDASYVDSQDDAMTALRVLTTAGLPGVVVRDGATFVVIPASQALRVLLPSYVLDDPSLGRVWDEESADAVASRLDGRHVADLVSVLDLSDSAREPVVDGDATLVEIAAVMAAARVPMVAVVDDGHFVGVVTVNRLVGRLLG